MLHSFSIPYQVLGTQLSFQIHPVLICSQLGQQSRQFCKFSFLLLIIIRSGLLVEIRLSVCMSKSYRSLCELFSRRGALLYLYHLLVWSYLNFLHFSQQITFPTQSCLVLYSFCANLLHSQFYLCHCIPYICYFAASYLFSL